MEVNNIAIIITSITSVLISLVAFFLFKNLKNSKYDLELNKVALESIRNVLERQIYSINNRMVVNEERWKDVNHLLLEIIILQLVIKFIIQIL